MFRWGIDKLVTSGGEEVELDFDSVLLVIGPNGSGKSTALRDILHFAQGGSGPRQAIAGATFHREGTAEEFETFMRQRYPVRSGVVRQHFTRGGAIPVDRVRAIFDAGERMHDAQAFLVHLLDTANRLTVANFTNAIDVWENAPQQYIHVLQAQENLMTLVSSEVQGAFGESLVVDPTALSTVGFRLGTEPKRTVKKDRLSAEYAENIRVLPRLDEQGDGVRSFVGALLAALCGAHPVFLLDEPEAFLHPPQARRLGAALARSAVEAHRQVIVATHSADVLQGALDASKSVSVLRLTRDGDVNHGRVLGSVELNSLWSKPLLRSAAAVDGLFHRGTVITQADADARFYSAVAASLEADGELVGVSDVYFAAGGGKGSLATLAGSYKRLGLPTAVVADLDLLRNDSELDAVLRALGSDLDRSRTAYNGLMSALNAVPPNQPIDDFVKGIRKVLLKSKMAGKLSGDMRREISTLVQNAADWSEVKRLGIAKLRGGALTGAQDLLNEWRTVGLFLVPVGELEGWWPAGPAGDKPSWIVQAIEESRKPGSMAEARQYVTDLIGFAKG